MIYLAPTIFLAPISNKRPPLGPFPSKNPSSFMMIFHFFYLKRLSNNVFIIKKSGFLEDLKIDLISAHPRASEIYLAPWALIRSFTVTDFAYCKLLYIRRIHAKKTKVKYGRI